MKPLILLLLAFLPQAAHCDELWNPFYFHPIGNCNDPSSMKFEYLDTLFTSTVGKTPKGESILLLFKVELLSNQNYHAQYEEYTIDEHAGSLNERKTLFSQNLIGIWQRSPLEENQIDLFLGKSIVYSLQVTGMQINGKTLIGAGRWPELGRGPGDNAGIMLELKNSSLTALGQSGMEYCKNPF